MSRALITNLRKLSRKKYRSQNRQFIAEGLRTVDQIMANSMLRIDYLVFDESSGIGDHRIFRDLHPSVKQIKLNRKEFSDVSATDSPQGVLAVCTMPEPADLADFHSKKGCIVALNRIQDPGNTGTILRTSAWFGASGILCDTGTADLFHPKVVRSAAGATAALPWWEGSLEKGLDELESHGWKTYLLDAGDSPVLLRDVTPAEKTILTIGNEAGGIDKLLMKPHRTRVRIPAGGKAPAVESLNASVALSVALYEFIHSLSTMRN
ncbi:MAG: RNA methyltransferase [Balneolales bacterium]